jgi:hypothetical protein
MGGVVPGEVIVVDATDNGGRDAVERPIVAE